MKRIAVLFLLLTFSMYAQTYYMNVWSKGAVTSIPVSQIKKITFGAVTGVVGDANKQAVISTFELLQNYPNPFNPSTKIEYQIPTSGHVEIQLYNITGELVKTLTNGEQSAGKYSVNWNGKDNSNRAVASGVYIYRVMFGNSVLSKKMLLLK
jgi:hypothetical protein